MGSQAVAQFNDESFLQEDVVHLHRAYGLPRAKTVLVHGKRGRRDTSDTGGEGSGSTIITFLHEKIVNPKNRFWVMFRVSPNCLGLKLFQVFFQQNPEVP